MKILYVTNYRKIANASGGFINDYLNDLLYFGLFELFGSSVVDSTPIISLYEENKPKINPQNLWGGFTAFWLIEHDCIDRTLIEEKIKSKYYDLIIYGSIKRCDDYYNIASQVYDSNKIVLIDGDDDQIISPLSNKHPYFKRELIGNYKNIFPISFSIPTSKLTAIKNQKKSKILATSIPGVKETYIYTNEADYYLDYNDSFWGVTTRKAGWDCMRHYEILANYCIPYFINIENCPTNTMQNFPKQLISEAVSLFNKQSLSTSHYYSILDQLFEYTCLHLTTKRSAQKLLEKIL